MIKKHKEQFIILAVILILALLGIINNQKSDIRSQFFLSESSQNETEMKENMPKDEENQEIFVHISGAVKKPGVIQLKTGDRLKDAIDAVGGPLDNADMNSVNLALKMEDEMKIHIPTPDEVEGGQNSFHNQNISVIGNNDGVVNINSASKEELMTLPSIGEVKAEKIINHRDKERFEKKEDLMNVSGIGEKTFEQLKDLITVH